ncbi:MAG: preprotein translocase subunit SecG [Candidatus Sumerlaeaceae bacterium]
MIYVFAVFLIIYVLCCLVLVGFILTQEGKGGGLSGVMGASMGETFGFGGATATIRKFTSIAATVFLLFTIILTFLGERVVGEHSNAFFRAGTEAPAGAGVPAPGAAPGAAPQQPLAAEAASPVVEVQPDTAAAPAALPIEQPATQPAATQPAPAQAPAQSSEAAPAPAQSEAAPVIAPPAQSSEAAPVAAPPAPAEQPANK